MYSGSDCKGYLFEAINDAEKQKLPNLKNRYRKKDFIARIPLSLTYPTAFRTQYVLEGNIKIKNNKATFYVAGWKPNEDLNKEGIVAYLCSDDFPGIGRKTAVTLYNKFGKEIIDIIQNNPEKLKGILKPKQYDGIKEASLSKKLIFDIMQQYDKCGINFKLAQTISEKWGKESLEILETSPFNLYSLNGFPFDLLDSIALKICNEPKNPVRIRELIRQTLITAANCGHTFLFVEDINKYIEKHYKIEQDLVAPVIEEMVAAKMLSRYNDALYLPSFFECEVKTAKRIVSILTQKTPKIDSGDLNIHLRKLQEEAGIELADNQKKAIITALTNNICIITGGPGTGKSTIVKFIVSLYDKLTGEKPLLLAPTGRAAKRLNEITGEAAYTIHSALGLLPTGDVENPFNVTTTVIKQKFIIVDEFSMVDQYLAYYLFMQIKQGMKILLVGDSDQLPSVGAGNVLFELKKAPKIPIVELNEIFRQKENSSIIFNAHKIKDSQTDLIIDDQTRFIECGDHDDEEIIEVVIQNYLNAIHYAGIQNVLLLTPFRKNGLCSRELNKRIQDILNPSTGKNGFTVNGNTFRVNDRVLQTKNIEINNIVINNGDIGTIQSFEIKDGLTQVTIKFDDDKVVTYEQDYLIDLELGYCLTVHKSQGSEADVVIFVMTDEHQPLAQKNLLYTGITRAKKYCVFVAHKSCVDYAITNDHIKTRNTLLGHLVLTFLKKANVLSEKQAIDELMKSNQFISIKRRPE